MMRYLVLGSGAILLLLALVVGADSFKKLDVETQEEASQAMQVYKSPTCGCCSKWIEHAEDHEFLSEVHDVQNLNLVKQRHGIAPQYQSCHTAVHRSGAVFEGHVPAEVMRHFVDNPVEDAIGLAVPGMPVGSPGMEYGDRVDPYEVKLLMKDGTAKSYAQVDRNGIRYEM